MLIYNYGLFWQADAVNWGGKGKSGSLTGICPGYRKLGEVDFREQQGIYVLYDDNFRIIYIGQAGAKNSRLFLRLRQHRTDHLAQRWSRFSWFGILPVTESNLLNLSYEPEAPPVASVLNHIEGILLAAAEPPLNRQSGRFGSDVYQYVQATTAMKDALNE